MRKRSVHCVRSGLACAGLIAALGSGAGSALAQDAATDRAQSFQAVEGAVKEDVPGGPLLVAAYGVIWALMLLYLIRLVRLQQRAQNDVQRLEQVLARTSPRDGGG
jgi:hypothetical protein